MTNKEAIKIITSDFEMAVIPGEHLEAYIMAIKALMVYRDCKHCTHNIKVGNMRGCALWDCDFEDERGLEHD